MITYEMLKNAMNDVQTAWGKDGEKVAEIAATCAPLNMTTKEFLKHCSTCGGNWGGMLLTGLQELRPEVWEAIPDNMGCFAW